MKQAITKAAGTAALGIAIAAVAAGSASAAGAGGLPIGGLPDTGSLAGTLGKAPAVGGPVAQTTGILNPQAAPAPAPAAEAPAAEQAGTTRGLPVGPLQSAVSKAPVAGALGSAVPLGASLPGLG